MNRTLLAILQLLAVLSFCGAVVYVAYSGVDFNVDFKWIVVGGFTLLIFGRTGYHTRDLWCRSYWVTIVGVFILHCVAVVLLQRNNPMLPAMVYVAIGVVEGVALEGLLLPRFNKGYRS